MRLALASAALFAAGCSCGCAVVSDAELDFGTVRVGTTASGAVMVVNPGPVALELQSIGPAGDEFTVAFEPRLIAPGGTTSFAATFTPAAGGPRASNAAVKTSGGTLLLQLRGTGSCESGLSAAVDFGTVLFGELVVKNVDLHGGQLVGGDVEVFTVVDGFVRFAPAGPGTYTAVVSAPDSCGSTLVTLTATSVASWLSCDATDFGFVNPGIVKRVDVTVRNVASTATTFDIMTTGDFAIVGNTTLDLAAHGEAKVTVEFRPQILGRRMGTLSGPMFSCPLAAINGGPDLEVTPSPLAFGQVPYFPTAPQPSFAVRPLTLHNRGSEVLHVASVLASPMDDIEVFAGGFEIAPGATFTVPVKVVPSAANLSLAWTITIRSDDPDSPALDVAATAQSVVLPPCQYSVTPTSLAFGRLAPPEQRDLSFTIRNLGMNANETCLITGVDLAAGTDPMFSLVGGPVYGRVLQPGGVLDVQVRAAPTVASASVVAATGAVEFGISSPTVSARQVDLTAQRGTGCIVVSPRDLQFGAVAVGCASGTRTVNVYNVCSTPVTLLSLQTPTLELTSPFSAGTVLQPGALAVSFTYLPANVGRDDGLLVLHTSQSDEVLTFSGEGNLDGVNADVFHVARPKADFLLVIDDSGSMSDKQVRLHAGLTGLFQRIVSSGIDFHIGAIASEAGATRWGKLMGPTPVMTSTTPNLAAAFGSATDAGVNGGTEAFAASAWRALTPPLVDTANAGFLRGDATLSITAFTDAYDDITDAQAAIYAAQFERARGNYNVVGPFLPAAPPNCSYDASGGSNGHLTMQRLLGGEEREICDVSWDSTLDSIVQHAAVGGTRFVLLGEPGASISVEVNGLAVLPTYGAVTVWAFEPATRALQFLPGYQPTTGDTVRVTYVSTCN